MDEWDGSSVEQDLIGRYEFVVRGLAVSELAQCPGSTETEFISPPTSSDSSNTPHRFAREIADLPNEPYILRRLIPVIIEEIGPAEYIASFREANIAMPGESLEEAMGNLVADILDTYEDLGAETPELLGPGPREQLAILRTYLRSTEA